MFVKRQVALCASGPILQLHDDQCFHSAFRIQDGQFAGMFVWTKLKECIGKASIALTEEVLKMINVFAMILNYDDDALIIK